MPYHLLLTVHAKYHVPNAVQLVTACADHTMTPWYLQNTVTAAYAVFAVTFQIHADTA